MNIVKAETILTVNGTAGEIAEVALHLGLNASGGEVFVVLAEIDDSKKEWLEKKMDIFGLHDMMSVLFEVVEETVSDNME